MTTRERIKNELQREMLCPNCNGHIGKPCKACFGSSLIEADLDTQIDRLETLIAEREKEAIESIKFKFIREFCNDHNREVRWLRGIALDMPDLLEQILNFFDKQLEKISK